MLLFIDTPLFDRAINHLYNNRQSSLVDVFQPVIRIFFRCRRLKIVFFYTRTTVQKADFINGISPF